ncbi:MAG: DUF692 domain-containing protein [Cyanobacteria bacterium SZAS LIN-5]|nr:DUF692 domain-containing protein [Cyanobacteria bacterium SZAS LIN-5]
MLGIGWRPELAWMIQKRKDIDFVEILAEDFSPSDKPLPPIKQLMTRGVDVIIHGTTLNLGGSETPSESSLAHLDGLARRYESGLVSEHLAFVKAGGMESGHLLPIQRTQENLEIVVENIMIAQQALSVPLAIENIATLFEWPDNEMDEATFLAEVLSRTGASLLLDVANLFANATNHNFKIEDYLNKIPFEQLAYVHVAGGIFKGSLYHDTHCHSIKNPVLKLLQAVCMRANSPRVLLERDGIFPGNLDEELNHELDMIKEISHSKRLCHAL